MGNIEFDYDEQHFRLKNTEKYNLPKIPLTVTLQITRKCNLDCIYCSESEFIPDPSLNQIREMIKNLKGVKRVIIAGGEPTMRNDLLSILKMCRNNFEIVAMASNCVRINNDLAKKLVKYVNYIDVTIDGPRRIHNQIRGSYDKIMEGLWKLKSAGIEISIVMVLLEQNRNSIFYVSQISDVIGAKKLKILSPISKGKGKHIILNRLSSLELNKLYKTLKKKKEKMGWKVRITIANWEDINEGHALLIHPNGDIVASPVWSNDLCIRKIGNILDENIKTIWENYPYKKNHVMKYLERSLMVL